MSPIESLPTELLLAICIFLDTADVNFLAQANRGLYSRINPNLYKQNSVETLKSALIWAAEKGIIGTARSALKYGANVDTRGPGDRTALGICAEQGHADLAILLLKLHASVNLQDLDQESPLGLACCGNRATEVDLRLEALDQLSYYKRELNKEYLIGRSSPGHIRIVKALIHYQDIEINTRNYLGYTPLLQAVRLGHLEICNLLLTRDELDVNLPSTSLSPPLHWAIHYGHIDIVASLLSRSDLNVNLKNRTSTALYEAAFWHRPKICKLLLQRHDILINIKGSNQETPLFVAVSNAQTEIVYLLLQRPEIDVNAKNHSSMSPLSKAASRGNIRILIMLLWHPDTDLFSRDKYGDTPWNLAYEENIMAALLVLIFILIPRNLTLRLLVVIPLVLYLGFRLLRNLYYFGETRDLPIT